MHNKIAISAIALITVSSIFGCATTHTQSELDKKYQAAIIDAAQVSEAEISKNLYAVNKENKDLIWNVDGSKILVATWSSKNKFDKHIKQNNRTSDNAKFLTWVTLVPQVHNLCHGYIEQKQKATKEEVDLRLKQYLGLPHTNEYDIFVEMWVSPKDLFRPCVDPEIHDTRCHLHFEEGNIPNVKNIKEYDEFYRNLYYGSIRSKTKGVFPWTGLGYTHDWGNPLSKVGASEYILSPGSAYDIKEVMPTMKYCEMDYAK
uniref:Lipoprotein n=1 Tax=Candidatus Kentrum sp. LPFa TaxID=2126335 RepID=A0A450W5V1_9GAMM|nr:MAG: hypothetical protein BECKLPF1236B_GA0070989_103511 [Candidatus Kentron sp. LPFa]